jgi:hypothetical protein
LTRSETINGEKEYKVAWGANVWKCSVFLHDTSYAAGFKPDMTANNHYQLAGPAEHDRWTFSIVGAETSRAAESERKHTMLKGSNENTSGKKNRFFRPKQQRGA